jgi:putative tricarboxylic transport membrane protein
MSAQNLQRIFHRAEGAALKRASNKTALAGCLVSVATIIGGWGVPSAMAAEPYYAGKTINVVMGLGPSSGGATVGRLLSKYLSQYIAGNPKVVVKHMPGAALMKAHRYIISKAPKDGTTIYYGPRSPVGELLKLRGQNFKYTDFSLLGGIQVAALVIYARTNVVPGGLKRAADIVNGVKLKYGGLAAVQGRMLISMLGLDMIGAKYIFVPGYRGSGKIRAAILNGEINIATDAAHAYRNRVVPQLVKKNTAIPLFSIPELTAAGKLVKSSIVPEIPSLPELYRQVKGTAPSGPAWDAIRALIQVDQTMQHVFLGPPGMNKKAVAAIRKAFMPAFTNDSFKREAKKILTYVPRPVGYARAQKVLAANSNMAPANVAFIKAKVAELRK